MGNDITTPFGTYALPARRERLRARVATLKNSRLNRARISQARKKAIKGLGEPFDVEVASHIKARLYPQNNRCEKRALCGVQIWDNVEREALKQAIEKGSDEFVFLDVGANVGLYSLFAHAYAKEVKRPIRLIAIEPAQEMAERLSFNAATSDAQVELVQAAVSNKPGHGTLIKNATNHGETQLSLDGDGTPVTTLPLICKARGIDKINALKLDVEGHDYIILAHFLDAVSPQLYPELLILETDADDGKLVEFAKAHHYVIKATTRMNTVLEKNAYV